MQPIRGNRYLALNKRSTRENGIRVTKINVLNEEGSKALGKMLGHYITIEVPALAGERQRFQDRVATKLAQEFEQFLREIGITKDAKALIIGLGNSNVTPDALGPLVVDNVMVTRHYFELVPDDVSPGYRAVSAVAPGVLGQQELKAVISFKVLLICPNLISLLLLMRWLPGP